MKYLSLFSGIGGFELGITQAYENIQELCTKNERQSERTSSGDSERQSEQLHQLGDERLSCIGFSEIDKYATQIYQKHFPNHKNYGDITKINEKTLPDFDLLVGGFPCQSFSIAGKRGGFEDTRGTMFFEIARIVKQKRPRLLLLENVKGLLSHNEGQTFLTIVSTLDELGYDVQWQVLNSKNHGVPQNRERVFIIGHLRGTSRPQVFPFGEGGEVYEREQQREGCANTITATYGHGVDTYGQRTFVADYRYDEGIRPRKEFVSPTLTSTGCKENSLSGKPLLSKDSKIRRLTPTECARLQGFPDNWHEGLSDTQAYKCYGNAVTVNVIKDIMEKLL
jgi:DNA (cytosine-5)-methyltransferase 1